VEVEGLGFEKGRLPLALAFIVRLCLCD